MTTKPQRQKNPKLDEAGKLAAITMLSRFSVRVEEASVAASLLSEEPDMPSGNLRDVAASLKTAGDALQAVLEAISAESRST